jgi:phage FluMu gp28-like protein
MILSDRIQDHLANLTPQQRRKWITKQQRTQILFSNQSRIIALPCSENLLRGYTAHVIIADEANFFQNDQDIFYSILLPMLSTTNGTLIASSTPWNRDSVFYRFTQDTGFRKYVVTCEEAVKAGLMTQQFIDQMKQLLPTERFQREYESQFVEDVDAWLTQSLIVSCIDSNLEPYDFQDMPKGEFYVGVDFGKEQDYSVVLVVEKFPNAAKMVHVHRFPLHTEFASVIGYVKSLQDRWQTVRAVYADITGVGGYIVEDMVRSGIQNIKGVNFTVQSKEEMATILREKMRTSQLKIPYVPTRRLEDIDLTAELNIEKYELMKTGHLRFSHPEGGHDDVFWSVALAVYASVQAPLPGKGAVMLPH